MDFDSRLPIYEQLQRHIEQQIVAGIYPAGSELPSRRSYAQQLRINPNTVQRAFKILEEEQLIETMPNVPSRVTNDSHRIATLREKLLDEAIVTFLDAIAPLHINPHQLIDALEKKLIQRGEQND